MSRRLVVLLSFPRPKPTSNPYNVLLADGLRALPDLDVLDFSYRTALLRRYDLFHVHWPDILVEGHSPAKQAVRQVLFGLLLLKLRITRTAVVRTMHNLAYRKDLSGVQTLLLRLLDRWTTVRITINTTTDLPPEQAQATVLHGHYREWYAQYTPGSPVPGRLLYFGTISPYKGVESLVRTFRQTPPATVPDVGALSLRVVGRCSDPALELAIRSAAGSDARIQLALEFVDDRRLVEEVGAAELVVLAYREMHNSGAVLAALSLDRPVLVPANAVNQRLAEEVGPGWVHTYDDDLRPEDLARAVAAVRACEATRAPSPDLSERDWEVSAALHDSAYRDAVRFVRGEPES